MESSMPGLFYSCLRFAKSISQTEGEGREGGWGTTRNTGATWVPSYSQDAGLVPAQGYNQEKASVSVVWSFLFVSEKLPRRLWDPGSSSHRTGGLRRRRGQGRRRWAVPGAAQGRQADKAPPAPSPTAAFQRGGEGGLEGWDGEGGRGGRGG